MGGGYLWHPAGQLHLCFLMDYLEISSVQFHVSMQIQELHINIEAEIEMNKY